MDILTLSAFALVAFIGIATPGPTVLLALTNGSRYGIRRALPGMAGAFEPVLTDPVRERRVRRSLAVLLAAVAVWFGWSTGL